MFGYLLLINSKINGEINGNETILYEKQKVVVVVVVVIEVVVEVVCIFDFTQLLLNEKELTQGHLFSLVWMRSLLSHRPVVVPRLKDPVYFTISPLPEKGKKR